MRKNMTSQEKNIARMERNARMWAAKIARAEAWKREMRLKATIASLKGFDIVYKA